ncbi:hypothetical protein HY004_00745 [Candidatus Saccharibacteria bacterium]|nr:hypothetical protein [Candidatus Saccharibacteria bacterium]
MQYLYHAVPNDLKDDKLYALNTLKEKHPDLYRIKNAKYEGREEVTQQSIPLLDCLWNDVIFLTAVHPQTLLDAYRKAGGSVDHSLRYFQIDVDSLQKDNLVVASYTGDGYKKTYELYNTDNIKGYSTIPGATIDYFTKELTQGRQPLYYAYIPHVLYKGAIGTKNLPIIEAV